MSLRSAPATGVIVHCNQDPIEEAWHRLRFQWKYDEAMERRTRAIQNEEVRKVGRNDHCPCGSDKKYKKCHGH